MNNADGAIAHEPSLEIARILARLRAEVREYLKHLRSAYFRHLGPRGRSPSPVAGLREARRKAAEDLLEQIQARLAHLEEGDVPIGAFRARLGIDQDYEATKEAWLALDTWLQAAQRRLIREDRVPSSVKSDGRRTQSLVGGGARQTTYTVKEAWRVVRDAGLSVSYDAFKKWRGEARKRNPRSEARRRINEAWRPDLGAYSAPGIDSVCEWMRRQVEEHAKETGLDMAEAREVIANDRGW